MESSDKEPCCNSMLSTRWACMAQDGAGQVEAKSEAGWVTVRAMTCALP